MQQERLQKVQFVAPAFATDNCLRDSKTILELEKIPIKKKGTRPSKINIQRDELRVRANILGP